MIGEPKGEAEPPPEALEDLAQRKAQADRRDISGVAFGDPPSGRSALDRKMRLAAERGVHWSEVKD